MTAFVGGIWLRAWNVDETFILTLWKLFLDSFLKIECILTKFHQELTSRDDSFYRTWRNLKKNFHSLWQFIEIRGENWQHQQLSSLSGLIDISSTKLHEFPTILMCSSELLQPPNPTSTTLKAFPIHFPFFFLSLSSVRNQSLKLKIFLRSIPLILLPLNRRKMRSNKIFAFG